MGVGEWVAVAGVRELEIEAVVVVVVVVVAGSSSDCVVSMTVGATDSRCAALGEEDRAVVVVVFVVIAKSKQFKCSAHPNS